MMLGRGDHILKYSAILVDGTSIETGSNAALHGNCACPCILRSNAVYRLAVGPARWEPVHTNCFASRRSVAERSADGSSGSMRCTGRDILRILIEIVTTIVKLVR